MEACFFYRGLDTKLQSFNYKLVHKALPTLEVMSRHSNRFHTSWCPFCREELEIFDVENEEHIFLNCYIARAVWHLVNGRLRNNGLDVIAISKENLFYKSDMSGYMLFLFQKFYGHCGEIGVVTCMKMREIIIEQY